MQYHKPNLPGNRVSLLPFTSDALILGVHFFVKTFRYSTCSPYNKGQISFVALRGRRVDVMLIHNIRRPALPLALTTMLGISIFGVIIWRYNIVSARYTKNINQMQAYHLAYSTADAMAKFLIENPAKAAEVIATTAVNNNVGPLRNNETFRISVTGIPTSLVTIVAKGRSEDATEKVQIDLVPVTTKEIFTNAIFSKANLTVPNRVHITGNLESAGTVSVPSSFDPHFVVTENSPKAFLPPAIPTGLRLAPNVYVNQALTIQGDLQYNIISVAPNGTLIFDTQGKVQRVVVQSLFAEGNVFAIGGGRLELYVTSFARFQTPFIVNPAYPNLTINDGGITNFSDPNDLLIILADDANLVLRDNAQINSFIYGPGASVQLQSARSTIKGAIIASKLDLQDGNVYFGQIEDGITAAGAAGFRRSIAKIAGPMTRDRN